MNRQYNYRPEHSLQRAEELISAGKSHDALNILHEVVMNRRIRSIHVTAYETIMMKLVELCVENRRGRIVKEALHQYKSFSQANNSANIENVTKYFLTLSEEKVLQAQQKVAELNLDHVEDLEEIESPESILLKTIDSKSRVDHEVLTPWVKFLWESYRLTLDLVKNNSRFEEFYCLVVRSAFDFCLKYKRKNEFKRLSELLRLHLSSLFGGYGPGNNPIKRNNSYTFTPDTMQLYLDLRFMQLNIAADLELWQEGFRSIEDIHGLLGINKRKYRMLNYFERLTKIFQVGNNYLFHAAAYLKLFLWKKKESEEIGGDKMNDEEYTKIANLVTISILAIPNDFDTSDDRKMMKLTNLLFMKQPPTKSILIKEVENKNLLSFCSKEIQVLFHYIKYEFDPLNFREKVEPFVKFINSKEEFKTYLAPLQNVILFKILSQISNVYSRITIKNILKLTDFLLIDEIALEVFIMNACRNHTLNIRIDHQNKCMIFMKSPFERNPSVELTQSLHSQLTLFAKSLIEQHRALGLKEKVERAKPTIEDIEKERLEILERNIIIEKRKELLESIAAQKDKELMKERQLRILQEQEMLKEKLKADSEKREQERRAKEMEEMKKEESKKFLEEIKKKMELIGKKIDLKELEGLSKEEIIKKQYEQLDLERKEMEKRLKSIQRSNDHVERAIRKENRNLLIEMEKKVENENLLFIKRQYEEKVTALRVKHENDIKEKKSLDIQSINKFKNILQEKRNAVYNEKKKINDKLFEEEKKKLTLEHLEKKRLEKIEREKQDKLEKERLEAEAKLENERKVLQEKQRLLDLEKKKLLDEAFEKQRLRDEEMERKIQEKRNALLSSSNASSPTSSGTEWRTVGKGGVVEKPANEKPPATADAYVPPHLRRKK